MKTKLVYCKVSDDWQIPNKCGNVKSEKKLQSTGIRPFIIRVWQLQVDNNSLYLTNTDKWATFHGRVLDRNGGADNFNKWNEVFQSTSVSIQQTGYRQD